MKNLVMMNRVCTLLTIILLLTPATFATQDIYLDTLQHIFERDMPSNIATRGAITTITTTLDLNTRQDLSSNLLNTYSPSGIYNTHLFSGSATYSYPLEVPPGVGGLIPQISINYNHHQTANRGVLGNAWTLSASSIHRDQMGTSRLDDDIFYLNFGGGSLKLIDKGDRFVTEVDQYFRIRKLTTTTNQRGEYWELTTKEGTQYLFGTSPDSELLANIFSTDSPVGIWSLKQIKDVHGNTINYTYHERFRDDIYPYLKRIEYGYSTIEFKYEQSHYGPNGFFPYAHIRQNYLLDSISIFAKDDLVRRYELSYEEMDRKQFLTQITQYGSDNQTSLPPTTFSYYHLSKGWNTAGGYSIPTEAYLGTSTDRGVRFLDMNADGFDDILRMDSTNDLSYWLNTGSGNWASKKTIPNVLQGGFVNDIGQDLGVRFYDVNDDTLIDMVKLLDEDIGKVSKIQLNKQDNFEQSDSTIPTDIAFIKKDAAGSTCEPALCPQGFQSTGLRCSAGTCTRTCRASVCSTQAEVVLDSYSDSRPGWNRDNNQESDIGVGYTPHNNYCYRFEFTGSQKGDDDDSQCYDLYTDNDNINQVYYRNCNDQRIKGYSGIGFTSRQDSSSWLSTVQLYEQPPFTNYYFQNEGNPDWNYKYVNKIGSSNRPDSDENPGDWDDFSNDICDDAGTFSVHCAPTQVACDYWGQTNCGYGCANQQTHPFVTMGVYVEYNDNYWDAVLNNWDDDCDSDIRRNDYDALRNHYKVTRYPLQVEYVDRTCSYAATEYKDTGLRLADINGDGKTDFVKSTEAEKRIWLNSDHGFLIATDWDIPSNAVFENNNPAFDMGTRLIDINGDFLPDLVKATTSEKKIWLNTGFEFIPTSEWRLPTDGLMEPGNNDLGVVFLDLNGDGLTDILKANSALRRVWINTGYSFVRDNAWNLPSSFNLESGSSSLADFTGDGHPDLIIAPAVNDRTFRPNRASKAYLLRYITNMYGGTVILDYEKISSLDNTGEDDLSDLPFRGWVVSRRELNNGMSGLHRTISTTQYRYQHGLYDTKDKQFRGFGYVEEILPDSSIIKHHYNQDGPRTGIEYRSEIEDDNKILQRTDSVWEVTTKDEGYYQVKLKEQVSYEYV